MNFCLLIIFFYIWKSVYTEFSYTTEFFTQVVATGGCIIWNSNLIGYLVSIYLASFRWKELRKEKKKVSFCRTLLLACWNRFYTQFDMLLSKKHRQSWDYHLVLAKLPSFFLLSRLKCRYISFTLYFAHQNSSFIQIVNTQRIKTHF